jgi:hypothetical protein
MDHLLSRPRPPHRLLADREGCYPHGRFGGLIRNNAVAFACRPGGDRNPHQETRPVMYGNSKTD